MWLLNFHIVVSILCLLFGLGFGTLFKEVIKKNGWTMDKDKKNGLLKRIMNHWVYFVPILNVILCLVIIVMIAVKKSEYTELVEHTKENMEDD